MGSTNLYPWVVRKDRGYPSEEVIFSGKDAEGKTILKDPATGLLHQHKQKQQQSQSQVQQQAQQPKSDYDKSVDNGITAFGMMSSLIGLVKQNQHALQGLDDKISHLTKLVYALTEQQKQQQ